MKNKIKHWQIMNVGLAIFDILAINLAYLLALFLRFDFTYSQIPVKYLDIFVKTVPIYTAFTISIFYFLKMYRALWRFASVTELFRSIIANSISTIFYVVLTLIAFGRMPISCYIMGSVIQFILVTGIRFVYKIYIQYQTTQKNSAKTVNTLIVGAGEAGRLIMHDLKNYKNKNYKIIGFIDDDSNKWGRYVSYAPIFGGRDEIVEISKKYSIDLIIVAIPSATLSEKQAVLNIIKETGIKLKTIPMIPDLLQSGNIRVKNLRDVQIEDLLERNPIALNSEKNLRNISGKTVLVTGGGGTIGSELCRQIARYNPKRIIIFDIYENNTYEIEQELKRKYSDLELIAIIGSVRDTKRLDDVFNKYRPEIVYHAAAHKHVPLMENSPTEAIKNNVFGTYNTAFAALRYKVDKFVLISTDKAVNPTNVMGATKRICEMIIQSFDRISKSKDISLLPKLEELNHSKLREFDNDFKTNFVAVRFGNVLGSSGSVIPLFKKQIEEGGPVTVTHKDIIRYFMTIPEAVGLVIEAGFKAKEGEIFVLDMGEPVKIDTLARNLIKLSGLRPDEDIQIVYSGLRPGEKLYEEKLMAEEGLKKTDNETIHIAKPIDFEIVDLFSNLEAMSKYDTINDIIKLKKLISNIVKTYHSAQSDLEKNREKFEKLYEGAK